ncbi:hypothetical protein GW17_00008796, partial [Ensete ventricosum]
PDGPTQRRPPPLTQQEEKRIPSTTASASAGAHVMRSAGLHQRTHTEVFLDPRGCGNDTVKCFGGGRKEGRGHDFRIKRRRRRRSKGRLRLCAAVLFRSHSCHCHPRNSCFRARCACMPFYVNVITVFEIKFDDCVAHAIRLLYENNVSGAAIIDPADSASKKSMDRDIGFIDFSSMVLWSLEVSDRTVSFIYICYQEIDKVRAVSKEGNHGFFDMLEKNSHIGRTKVFFSLKK